MTNYIEKMMKTAGISDCKYCDYKMEECGCFYCDEVKYPDFTAKKQLEIIKLISRNNEFRMSTIYHYKTKEVSLEFVRGDDFYIVIPNQEFTQALAQLTTELMNAGKLDKSKVKEILE